MRKETLINIVVWFIMAALFYGFEFGWGKLSSNLYASYLLSSLGKTIGFSIVIPICHLIGRRKTILILLICQILCNFLAMPHVRINENWTLEYIACLLGFTALAGAFASVFLLTIELAPTSHRGTILSLSSGSARVGSFIGTYISLLYDVTERWIPLALMAGAGLLCMAAVFLLSDTTGRAIPETPQDVEVMTGSKEYQAVDNGTQEL